MMRLWGCALLLVTLVPAPGRAQDQAEDPGQDAELQGTSEQAEESEEEPALVGPPSEASQEPPSGPTATLLETASGETLGDIEAPSREGPLAWAIEPGIQVFGDYRIFFTNNAGGGVDVFHELDLPRAWIWTSFRLGDVMGRVLLEGTRTSGEGALIGVGGDSIVVRLREAWAGYRLFDMLEARVGLIPQLITPAITALWGLRAVSPIALRNFGPFELMQPADLGAMIRFDIPLDLGTVAVAYYNGEGYRSRELNAGKNFEALAQLRPIAVVEALAPLTVTLGYQNGSTGTGSAPARNDRFVGGLAWADPRWGVGLETAWIAGIEDRGDREAVMIEAWGRFGPIDELPLIVGARFAHLIADIQAGATATSASTFTGAVGVRIAEPLRTFVAFDVRDAANDFQTAVPGFERWALRFVVEANLAGRFEGSF